MNTYRHYKLNAPTKQTLNVSTFKGADYTPAQLDVKDYHAVDIKNIVWRDNVDQKRYGLEHCACAPIVFYEDKELVQKSNANERQINGVYEFIGEDGFSVLLIHAGKLLFYVTKLGKEYPFYNSNWKLVCEVKEINGTVHTICEELTNDFSQGFVGAHRLYLLDGNKYRVIRYIGGKVLVEDVEDNDLTYVPTTTIGIGISWKEKSAEDEPYKVYSPSVRTPLDDVNLLTQWRKNKLVSGLYFESAYSQKTSHFYDYELDTNIQPKNNTDINNIVVTINSLGGQE